MTQSARSKPKKLDPSVAKPPKRSAVARDKSKPLRRDAEATVERIITVATKSFAEKGYEGASIKEICREAGVNMAAIHYHFESKENLYRQVITKFGGPAMEAAIRSLQSPASLEELKTRLSIYINETIESANLQPEIAQMIIRDVQTHGELLVEVFEKTFGRLQEALIGFFKSAQEKGLIEPTVPIQLIVGTLQSQLQFVIGHRRLFKARHGIDPTDAEHRQKWISALIDLLINGIRRRV